ncbi:MAG: hypothetical protein Q8O91_07200, partial [Candidatus Aminicenantes bacterium]|nr:hypothetical protein [Candidatus Aminicenantes bacterium]
MAEDGQYHGPVRGEKSSRFKLLPLAGVKGRAFAAEVDPRAKPGALTRDVNTRLSTAETDPQTKPALIRFANE